MVKRYKDGPPSKGYVLFETGYGPSGLPHMGTFGEVVRTSMVRHAFSLLSDIPTKLICFSDDMDGLRKVPTNIPNQDAMAAHLGKLYPWCPILLVAMKVSQPITMPGSVPFWTSSALIMNFVRPPTVIAPVPWMPRC
ncbi:hypothetical protein JCM17844_27160 [Iodidimonas gelatinilytica]|uniref:Lysine--tRNA ligase n=1 Tax=Iodidimonas gelatinilytica TaxID=1236966 RepID=A0A5A7MW04_9PROT|nr:hypothetical protein JCM17844_27160 [Iodidimonas gelatinilytica]